VLNQHAVLRQQSARCDPIAAGFQRDVLICMANAGNFRFLSASSFGVILK
jgi:hypothetical protein